MARRKREVKKNRRTRQTRRKKRERRRRRKTFIPYILIFILLSLCIFFIARRLSHSVDRTVASLETAIKTGDRSYMENNTDRLDLIYEVLKKSYSEDGEKQDEFIKNNFKNLDIKVLNTLDIEGGREISLNVSNVNYIEAFDEVKNTEDDFKHQAYMEELSKAEVKNTDAKIFLKKKLFGYEIYESREFINGILGRALDLVK